MHWRETAPGTPDDPGEKRLKVAVVGASGYPPMLPGVRAFGKTCPWPP